MSVSNRKYFPTPPSLFLQNKHFTVRQVFFVIDKIYAIFEFLLIIKQWQDLFRFFFLSIKDSDLTFLSSSLLQENPLKYRNIVYIFIQSQHFPLIIHLAKLLKATFVCQ
jgi:hypothetical protein